MSERQRTGIHDAAVEILGGIEGVEISQGLIATTIRVRDESVATISVVAGVYLMGTRKILDARPRKSITVTWVKSSRDAEWQQFQTDRLADVRHSLHLAVPRIRSMAAVGDELEAYLDGRVEELDLDRSQPEYWDHLSNWASAKGAIPRARNVSTYAKKYAKWLRIGWRVSDRFASWAEKAADNAEEAGFRPIRIIPGGEKPRTGLPRTPPPATQKAPRPVIDSPTDLNWPPSAYPTGLRVRSATYGPGVVERIASDGSAVYVQFAGGLHAITRGRGHLSAEPPL